MSSRSQQTLQAAEAALQDPSVVALQDNASGRQDWLLDQNARLRHQSWPEPYDKSRHILNLGDARSLKCIKSGTVHLVVTSPPYWTLKKYNELSDQLGSIDQYEAFLDELDRVWAQCTRVLAPGGRLCCVVGDVCVSRRKNKGRHRVAPLHADIQVRQYSGTAGGIENRQVGVSLCYASKKGAAFIDRALYLPREWTKDQERTAEAGIPEEVQFAAKPVLAREMLEQAFAAKVPASWVRGPSALDSAGSASPCVPSVVGEGARRESGAGLAGAIRCGPDAATIAEGA